MSTPLSGVRALVVGFGSIGRTHADVLTDLGATVDVVTRRQSEIARSHASIEAALAQGEFDYCVISSATSDHGADALALSEAGFGGALLIEKPVTARAGEFPVEGDFERVGVGYNMRFSPVIRWLEERLDGQATLVVDVAAQSFLPDWRPGRDHRETESASAARGGGVVRDLSHEIDLMLRLFGAPHGVVARGGNLGGLGIEAETAVSALFGLERAPVVTLRLSYLDRLPERRVRVTTELDTIEVDLLSGACRVAGAEVEETFPIEWRRTYADLHLAMLGGPGATAVCSLEEGLNAVAFVEELESAIGGGVKAA
jgi:predicted dehydrogenase